MLKYLECVELVNCGEELSGQTGYVRGIASKFPELTVYIVEINTMLSNGYDCICITEHCLKSLK